MELENSIRSILASFVKRHNIIEEEKLRKIQSVVNSFINKEIDKKFKGIILNGYNISFSNHSKNRLRKRNITLDKVILAIRNIVKYKFIENNLVLFRDLNNCYIFDIKNKFIKVVTVVNGGIKDSDFEGNIIFERKKDNQLVYYYKDTK